MTKYYLRKSLQNNDLVIATNEISEIGFKDPDKKWVHAHNGDFGFVTYVNPGGYPTIRFYKSGTATILCPINDIVIVKNISSLPKFDLRQVEYKVVD